MRPPKSKLYISRDQDTRRHLEGANARIYDIASAIRSDPDNPLWEAPSWVFVARPSGIDPADELWPDDATLEHYERDRTLGAEDTDEQWADLLKRGRALADHWRQRELEVSRAKMDMVRADNLRSSGIPQKDLQSVIDRTLRETASITAARKAIDDGLVMVVLSGPVGIGKSTAAAWWLGEMAYDAWGWRGARPPVELLWVKAKALERWPKFDDAAMKRLEEAGRLVIDDFGQEYIDAKGALSSFIDGIIDSRYENRRPTLITTNLDSEKFVERYGARVVDRLLEGGRFITLTGESLRRSPQVSGPAAAPSSKTPSDTEAKQRAEVYDDGPDFYEPVPVFRGLSR